MSIDKKREELERTPAAGEALNGVLHILIWSIPFVMITSGFVDSMVGEQFKSALSVLLLAYLFALIVGIGIILYLYARLGLGLTSLSKRKSRLVATSPATGRWVTVKAWLTVVFQGVLGNFVFFLCGIVMGKLLDFFF